MSTTRGGLMTVLNLVPLQEVFADFALALEQAEAGLLGKRSGQRVTVHAFTGQLVEIVNGAVHSGNGSDGKAEKDLGGPETLSG